MIAVVAVCLLGLAMALYVTRISRRAGDQSSRGSTQSGKGTLAQALRRAWGGALDEGTWERFEEVLLAADMGVDAAERVVTRVRKKSPETEEEARRAVAEAVMAELGDRDRGLHLEGTPAILLVVGVNGSGKTTTIAKLAQRFLGEGRSVLLAAADTYRAAAGEQLEVWGERVGVPVLKGEEGADPASVAHDAVTSARASGIDVVIVDTAGRLHSKKNLMEELSKMHRVIGGASEILLVLDATNGQNGLTQVSEFMAAVPVTGVVLTKLDGTARGGFVVAVESRLGVPVKLIGHGEGPGDLSLFNPGPFVASLLDDR